MTIYAIYNRQFKTFLKWGVNGGGIESYRLHRGKPCFFYSLLHAQAQIKKFDNPGEYEIMSFKEVRE